MTTQTDNSRGEITHRTPTPYALGGDGTTPCCGRSPFELPQQDRITNDDTLVTCTKRRGSVR